MRDLVTNPRFDDPGENAKRRALFFIRHLSLWRELPRGTEWFEVEVLPENLDQIRVFPRALWRKFARGNFAFPAVADHLRTFRGNNLAEKRFVTKIASMRDQLSRGETDAGTVLLIGLTQSEPLTILDGNHRLMAAALNSPQSLHRLRFFCGLSPKMTMCCWYKTNAATLFRYGTNLLTHAVHDPEAELERLLQGS